MSQYRAVQREQGNKQKEGGSGNLVQKGYRSQRALRAIARILTLPQLLNQRGA